MISQHEVAPGSGTQQGFGNITQSFFFAPKEATAGGILWGAGPVLVLPTAGDGLGANQWGLGLTFVVVKQTGPWTVGVLANNIWSVTDNDKYGKTSNGFAQPFLAYATPKHTTFSLNTEASYNWNTDQLSVPINLGISQLVPIAGRPVSLSAGARYWAESPKGGPQGWGWKVGVTYLFPK